MNPSPELISRLSALSERVLAARSRPEDQPLSPTERSTLREELRAAIAAIREHTRASVEARVTAAASKPKRSAKTSTLQISISLPGYKKH